MPYHDLNIPYDGNDAELSITLAFLHELGYHCTAISLSATSKLPAQLPIIQKDRIKIPPGLTVLSRLNLTISDHSQNHRINNLVSTYDLVAVRPVNDKAFQLCCGQLDCDIISLDFSSRVPYPIKFKTVASALQRGVRFEICYAGGITGSNDARRNLISGAASLIRATRGRGIIISSEAHHALGLRAPYDAINLATIWGLDGGRAKEAVCEEAGIVVKLAAMKRSSFRGVVEVVENGSTETTTGAAEVVVEKIPESIPKITPTGTVLPPLKQITVVPEKNEKAKRKASQVSLSGDANKPQIPRNDNKLSKREAKRQSKKARLDRGLPDDNHSQQGQKQRKDGSQVKGFAIQHEALMTEKHG